MALSDIIGNIALRLPNGVASLIGPEHLGDNAAPPRVVWIPSRDKYGPAMRVGGTQRSLRTRFAGVDVHVWSTDYSATESLLNSVQAAIHASCVGSYEFDNEDAGWLDMKGQPTSLGRVYVFRVRFFVPVTEAAAETATIESIPQQNVMTISGVNEDAG